MRSAGAVGSAARGASAPTEGGEGWGHIVAAARLQLVNRRVADRPSQRIRPLMPYTQSNVVRLLVGRVLLVVQGHELGPKFYRTLTRKSIKY